MRQEIFYAISIVIMLIGLLLSNIYLISTAFIVLIASFVIKRLSVTSHQEKTTKEITNRYKRHSIDNYYVGKDLLSSIGIDEKNNKIVFLTRSNIEQNFTEHGISFDDLFEVKLIEDEITLTTTSKASALGGSLVGGLIGGSTGAIIGGLSGSQHSEKEVRKISLELVVNDLSKPIYNLFFMNEDNFIKTYEQKYKDNYKEANEWFKMFSVIIKRNEQKQSV